MRVANFADIEQEFLERVNKIVWCNLATLDSKNRPRSRILHPYWEGSTGWIATHGDSHKRKHLDHSPYVSLAYIAEINRPVFVDCTAEWIDDPVQENHVWNLFL